MTPLTRAKLIVGGIGLAIWAYGVRVEDEVLTWVGVGLMAVAVLLRFLNRREGR